MLNEVSRGNSLFRLEFSTDRTKNALQISAASGECHQKETVCTVRITVGITQSAALHDQSTSASPLANLNPLFYAKKKSASTVTNYASRNGEQEDH